MKRYDPNHIDLTAMTGRRDVPQYRDEEDGIVRLIVPTLLFFVFLLAVLTFFQIH